MFHVTLTQGEGQIMFYVINASPPKPLDIATSSFVGKYVTLCRGYWTSLHVTLALRSISKWIFC